MHQTDTVISDINEETSSRILPSSGCSCTPTKYAWEVHIEHTCDSLYKGPGIEDVECGIEGPSGEPVYLTNIVTYEGNGNEFIQSNSQGTASFFDAAILSHTSILDGDAPEGTIVKEYRIEATGVLANGDEQKMYVHIKFTNDCDGKSVLNEGNAFGVFVVNSIWSGDVSNKYCPSFGEIADPNVDADSNVTPVPTLSPTSAPTREPTPVPTADPTSSPSYSPSQGMSSIYYTYLLFYFILTFLFP